MTFTEFRRRFYQRPVAIALCVLIGTGLAVLWIRRLPAYTPSALWDRYGKFLPDIVATTILVGVLAYSVRQVWQAINRRWHPSVRPEDTLTPIFFTDQPEPAAADQFALQTLSEKLARDIQLPAASASLVVSLEGAWGSGKTTLLNSVAARLETATSRPIIVKFNTWDLPTGVMLAQSLLKAMSTAIAARGGPSELDDALAGLGEDIDRLIAKKDDTLPGVLLRSALKLLRIADLGDTGRYKVRINQRLEELHVPIIVLLDDVDRLVPADIRNVFQLVHGAIDFTRVCYVLAYDPAPVHQALATIPRDSDSGLRFKEKIVQVTISFPRISPLRRHLFASSLLQAAMERRSIAADEKDQARKADALSIVLQLLRTPRTLKQAVNRIGFSADLLSGEVCLSDIMVFEALQLQYPSLMQHIRDRPELILQLHQQDEVYSILTMQMVHALQKREIQHLAVETLVKSAAQNDLASETRISGALRFLFPSLFAKSSGGQAEDPGPLGRIDDPNNLKKLLYLTIQPDSESAQNIREFLDKPQARVSILAARSTAGAAEVFFEQVARYFANVDAVRDPRALIDAVLECADVWFSSEGDDITRAAASLIENLLNEAKLNPTDRVALLRYVTLEAPRMSVGTNVLTHAFGGLGLWNNGEWRPAGLTQGGGHTAWNWLTSSEAEALRVEWIARVDATDWETLATREAEFSGIMYRRAQFDNNNYEAVIPRLRDLLMRSEEAARRFIRPYAGAWSVAGLDKLVPDMYWLHERLKTVRADETAIEKIRDQFEQMIVLGPDPDPSNLTAKGIES